MFTNDNFQEKVKKSNYTKEEKILLLLEFYNKFGKWPKYNEKYKEVNLGIFLQNIKSLTTKISNEDYAILKEKGAFILYKEYKKHQKVLLLLEFYEDFGRWPKRNEQYKGVRLGNFLKTIKDKSIKISDDDYTILKEKCALISHNEYKAHQKVLLLLDFYKDFGRWPKRNEQYEGVNLGNFLRSVKINVTKVPNDDYTILKEKGAFISYNEYKKHQKVLLLLEFYENFDRWPKYNEQYKDVNLGNFLRSVKSNVTKISNDDYTALRKKGFLIKL